MTMLFFSILFKFLQADDADDINTDNDISDHIPSTLLSKYRQAKNGLNDLKIFWNFNI